MIIKGFLGHGALKKSFGFAIAVIGFAVGAVMSETIYAHEGDASHLSGAGGATGNGWRHGSHRHKHANGMGGTLRFNELLSNYPVGINMAGHEFGGLPGKCGGGPFPTSNTHTSYYSGFSLNVARMPFLWERLEPQLYGPLGMTLDGYSNCSTVDRNTVTELHDSIATAYSHGMMVVIDAHGYGARQLQDPTTLAWHKGGTGRNGGYAIGSVDVPCTAFASFWQKMAHEYKNDPGLLGWDLMNEPTRVPNNAAGLTICYQAAINAIRATGDAHLIFIEPYGYASAEGVQTNNPVGTIETLTDPVGNLVYEGHQYADNNRTGTYTGSEARSPLPGQSPDLIVQRLTPFVKWLKTNHLNGVIGEFGVPSTARWEEVERRGVVFMLANHLPMWRWADWPAQDNILNPRDSTGATTRLSIPILSAAATGNTAVLNTPIPGSTFSP